MGEFLSFSDELAALQRECDDLRRDKDKLRDAVTHLERENESLRSRLATIERLWETMINHRRASAQSKGRADTAESDLMIFIKSGQ